MKKAKDWSVKHIRKGWTHLQPKPEMKKWQKTWRYAAIAVLGAFASGFIISFLYFVILLLIFDPTGGLPKDSTLILDREGNLLYTIHGEENRTTLDGMEEVSPYLTDATLAIEDDQFYEHIGIDIPGLMKAVAAQFGIGTPRGGSTITQQFVRNGYLTLEKSYIRKYREIMMSLVLELKFSKDEILMMYLNEIPYGNNAYGIELAAKRYFGKSAKELTLAESAVLASIPNAPSYYSPYGTHKYSALNFELTEESLAGRSITGEADLEYDEFDRGLIGKSFTLPDGSSFYLKGRSDIVLNEMQDLGMITEEEKLAALSEVQTLTFIDHKDTIVAAHFVMWVKEELEKKYGKEVVEQGGLRVTTTLDPDFQKAAEEAIEEKIESNKSSYNANNAALVSVQAQTGQILSMVGSAAFLGEEAEAIDGQVNMITSYRAPGSAFKPFVYALAFLNQYTPATVLYDVSTSWGSWSPKNFDGGFRGPMTIRQALGQSRNIPAVKAYFLAGQSEKIIPFVETFGMESISEQDAAASFGGSLSLGAANVTPLEFAEAYTVFANGGTKVEPVSILKIETADGNILEQWDESKIEKTEVLDPEVAYLINDILSDPSVNIGGNIYISAIDNAAKTGTSTDDKTGYANNGWIAAYTPTLVTIGWSGNTDGSPMNSAGEAYYTIAPIWKNYMNKVLNRLEPTVWNKPAGIREVAVSKACGTLPSEWTPSDMIYTEVFASFSVPSKTDDCYRKVKIETITGRLATEYSPADVVQEKVFRVYKEEWSNWQSFIDRWAGGKEDLELPPIEYADDIHNAETAAKTPALTIVSPSNLSSIDGSERSHDIEVQIDSVGNGLTEVTYYLNELLQYHAYEYPYTGNIRLPITVQNGDSYTITAKAVDQYGYSTTSSIEVKISSSSRSSRGFFEELEEVEELSNTETSEEASLIELFNRSRTSYK
ncbi:penicillin-binding protein [Candidatus Peregrinibacteria bacterium]|nr:MAG: penicillin-binding protein [Candidatus Peregrinibacteria bacterium]